MTLERRHEKAAEAMLPVQAAKQFSDLFSDARRFLATIQTCRAIAMFRSHEAGMTFRELSDELGCSRAYTQKLIREGHIAALHLADRHDEGRSIDELADDLLATPEFVLGAIDAARSTPPPRGGSRAGV